MVKSPPKFELERIFIPFPLNAQDTTTSLSVIVDLCKATIAGLASIYFIENPIVFHPCFMPEIEILSATTFPYLYAEVTFVFAGTVN